jgi:4-diphosphocytidyl-2-C-methyl-D-erythritol kinase
MLIERRGAAVRVWAPAKINLFLEVLARRADGYHDIATVMVAVSLYDCLDCSPLPDGRLELTCDNEALSVGPENLVLRAAQRLRESRGSKQGASLKLSKRIPMAAGLAGGSTDAAATLAALNLLWEMRLEPAELMQMGAEVGSDVPFFFATPAAWCTGRGEKVEPLKLAQPLWCVLACPAEGLATAAVYQGGSVPAEPSAGRALRAALERGEAASVGGHLHNRLQESADRLQPGLARLRQRLMAAGPAGALMSGSGTCCFALCRDQEEALRVACGLRGDGRDERERVYIVRSCV